MFRMVRRGQSRRNELRRASAEREAELAESQTYGDYRPPSRSECFEREFYLPVDDEATLRVDAWTWSDGRQMVDFSLTVRMMALVDGRWEWQDLARVDICHGHAHLHILVKNDDDARHLMRIDNVDHVQEAYQVGVVNLQQIARILVTDKENGYE